MRPSPNKAGKEDKALSHAEHGKVRQNPQPPRNQNSPHTDSSEEEKSVWLESVLCDADVAFRWPISGQKSPAWFKLPEACWR
jgi:hypothetical protein